MAKKRRMKKQVRKTLGALFLASAIVVAAIPTSSYEAGEAEASVGATDTGVTFLENHKRYWLDVENVTASAIGSLTNNTAGWAKNDDNAHSDWPDSAVPTVMPNETIFTNGAGTIQFAYVNSNGTSSGGTRGACILGYTLSGNLANNTFRVDEELEGYLQYSDSANSSAQNGNVAVNKNGKYLFYRVVVTQDGETVLDVSGNEVPTTISSTRYYPCYYSTIGTWGGLSDEELYFFNSADGKPVYEKDVNGNLVYDDTNYPKLDTSVGTGATPTLTISPDDQRLVTEVYWIGNQRITASGNGYIIASSGVNDYAYIKNSGDGVFSGNSNIGTLILPNSIMAVGDYAFYGCTGLKSIEFGNGITTIGNYAFTNCTSLKTVDFGNGTNNLNALGAYCFKNTKLNRFDLPISVATICDGAFFGCDNMSICDLTGGYDTTEGGTTSYPIDYSGSSVLANMGNYIFYGCASLEYLFFPSNFDQVLEIGTFAECPSLTHFITQSTSLDLVDSNPSGTADQSHSGWSFTLDEFKELVTEKFYIEGKSNATIHQTCTDNEIAFKYYGMDQFEKTIKDWDADPTGATFVTYTVDSSNTLIKAQIEGAVESLEFPEYIGPYHISSISGGTFRNQCTLKRLTIPATIESIGAYAFQGCHNLQYVYFKSDHVEIGEYAFQTQNFTGTVHTCGGDVETENNKPKVQLHFIGPISDTSTPYLYAMSPEGRYNNGTQAYSFIEYHSGFPTLLTVQYQYDSATGTGYSELVDFPVYGQFTSSTTTAPALYPYLTADDLAAITGAYSGGNLTEDQETYLNALKTLTIPTGVEAIKDGLFYSKTETNASVTGMGVIAYGLKDIEAKADPPTTGEDKDEFYNIDTANSDFAGCTKITSLQLLTSSTDPWTKTLDDYAFAGCTNMKTVYALANIDTIGTKAFAKDTALESALFYGSVDELGYCAFQDDVLLTDVLFIPDIQTIDGVPFLGCKTLSDVDFQNSTTFTCENSIIYELKDGEKDAVVELLKGRGTGNSITASEMEGINRLYNEAFRDTNTKEVDLSASNISKISDECFRNTPLLYSVTVPTTCSALGDHAFHNSAMQKFIGSSPSNIGYLSEEPILSGLIATGYTGGDDLNSTLGNHQTNSNVTICAPEGSTLRIYAENLGYDVQDVPVYYTVYFYDYTDTNTDTTSLVEYQVVEEGKDATPPAEHGLLGQSFMGWYDLDGNKDAYKNITADTRVVAHYTAQTFTVDFYTYDGSELISSVTVNYGADAEDVAPEAPERDGYTFAGWDRHLDYVTRDIETHAMYTAVEVVPEPVVVHTVNFYYVDGETLYLTFQVLDGDDAPNPEGPVRDGYTFKQWDKTLTNVTTDIDTVPEYESGVWTVNFYDYDGTLYYTTTLETGQDAPAIAGPTREGYTFSGWDRVLTNVTSDLDIYAVYTKNPEVVEETPIWKVQFFNYDGTLYYTAEVEDGKPAPPIVGPAREGYQFTGWDRNLDSIKANVDTVALYEVVKTPDPGTGQVPEPTEFTVTYYSYDGNTLVYTATVSKGGDAPYIVGPAREGYTFAGWDRELTNVTTNFTTRAVYISNSSGSSNPTYALTVINGSGSGSYEAGTTVIIVANDPAKGLEFSSWTVNAGTVTLPSYKVSATTITMPKETVVVTANYVAKTSGTGTSSSSSDSKKDTGKKSSGTTVVIDKSGLSNTGVTSATVNGSTDNFTIKITESASASEAVLRALMEEYGDDLSNIVYFPMDISLYDSTGTKKISDTSGLTVTITMPIPDVLRDYAGNNKVAAVIDGRISSLAPKFTTIDNVPCVTFTATHFSPYVIYVNKVNLTAGGENDVTPKTGDGIHPKWFLSIGLFAISVLLFLKKDKNVAAKPKTIKVSR